MKSPKSLSRTKKICLKSDNALLANHIVFNQGIFPAVGYFQILLDALQELDSSWRSVFPISITNAFWFSALGVPTREREVFLYFQRTREGYSYSVQTEDQKDPEVHASGHIACAKSTQGPNGNRLDINSLLNRLPRKRDASEVYRSFEDAGITYKKLFRSLEEFRCNEEEALGKITGFPESKDDRLRPDILDAAIQCVLLSVLDLDVRPLLFVPFSLQEMVVWQTPSSPCYAYATRNEGHKDKSFFRFDLLLANAEGDVLIEMKELCVKAFPSSGNSDEATESRPACAEEQERWVLAATFTAEPIREPLAFWMEQLQWDVNIHFAPYNQVFQELLSPQSLLALNRTGANFVLLRLEDLKPHTSGCFPSVSPEKREKCLSESERFLLPNGLEIAHLNAYETRYLYDEIFIEKTYLKQGVTLQEGDVVIDVGANIGMFSLFVAEQCKDARIFAFEPSPITFDVLKKNLALYAPGATVYHHGVSDSDHEAEFVFYPHSSVFSGFHTDEERDGEALRRAMENEVARNIEWRGREDVEAHLNEMVKGRLHKETYCCQLKSLSSLLKQYQIDEVGLLKIDAEKCEWAILKGIQDCDWRKIRQVVVEVHDRERGVISKQIEKLLKEKGFEVGVVEEELLEQSGLYNVYGRRSEVKDSTHRMKIEQGIEENVKELVTLLKRTEQDRQVPLLLGLCPPSPTMRSLLSDVFVRKMNHWVVHELRDQGHLTVVPFSDYEALYGWGDYHDPVRDAMGHIPYTPRFFAAMATVLVRNLYAMKRVRHKVIALDCDQTLWSGVVGEQGVEGVQINPAFLALQGFMLKQKERGVLLCLVSKNNEDDVRRVFEMQGDMLLKWEDFAACKINWEPKSENLKALAGDLNLGLDSFIFLDDSPVECAEVRAHCPQALTLQLPARDEEIPVFLNHIWAFDHGRKTEEDACRTELYQQHAEREQFREETLTFKDFIDGLALDVRISPAGSEDVERIAQLTRRTNQFNFVKKPLTAAEVRGLLDKKRIGCHVVRVTDRFGDYGLCGSMMFSRKKDRLVVDSFLLSCRALGRGVEHRMLASLGAEALRRKKEIVELSFVATAKNRPAEKFLQEVGASYRSEGEGRSIYALPVSYLEGLVFDPPENKGGEDRVAQASSVALPSPETREDDSCLMQQLGEGLSRLDKIVETIDAGKAGKHHPVKQPMQIDARPRKETVCASGDLLRCINRFIVEHISARLGVEPDALDEAEAFSEYGFDSMASIDLIMTLNDALDIVLPVTTLFDYACVKDLGHYIYTGYEEAIRRMMSAKGHSGRLEEPVSAEPVMMQERDPEVCDPGDCKRGVAVIGLSGRFPGARTLDEFWNLLSEGKSAITEVPAERWDIAEHYDPNREVPGKTYSKWGGFLDDVDTFDAAFFNISVKEAEQMDPQQRFFLEESWCALEHAGYSDREMARKACGVFVGTDGGDYASALGSAGFPREGHSFMGNHASILAARIAYLLNLKGAAIAIDTACSSSMAAVHMACESLLRGTVDMAIAGGVSIRVTPAFHVLCSKVGMLSGDGACKVFDMGADGFVPGEAVGVVVLKRLEDAVRDKDSICGVIKGSGMNQDGKTNGITAPSSLSQTELALNVYEENGIDPDDIGYVEAHGTGTSLGDPIEVRALTSAFRAYTNRRHYCAIGSVKSNIGHCVHAAGISGLIKLLLCLKYKKWVPSIHFEKQNPYIPFEQSPFFVNTEYCEWKAEENKPRIGAVSSFGFSGTNVHIVVEEPSERLKERPQPKPYYLVTLSAKSEESLKRRGADLSLWLERAGEDFALDDICYTLNVGRSHFEYRWALVVKSTSELSTLLKQIGSENGIEEHLLAGSGKKVTLEDEPIYKQVLNRVTEQLESDDRYNDAEAYRDLLMALGGLYVKGYEPVDLGLLYQGEARPNRIHLPTYPFTGKRYWLAVSKNAPLMNAFASSIAQPSGHPLLHQNRSGFSGQRFSSTFTGHEFFFADHRVKGRKILPGVAYLEMTRAAVEQASGTREQGQTSIQLKNVVWVRPIEVNNHAKEVHIRLVEEDPGHVLYEIYTGADTPEEERTVHSRGIALVASHEEAIPLDLPGLRAQIKQERLSSDACYSTYKAIGVDYGPGHQGLDAVYVGTDEVLAKLKLPAAVVETRDRFILHPSILDAALQASIGLTRPHGEAALPFALEQLDIIKPCSDSMWAWVRGSHGCGVESNVKKFDIDVCDEQGRVAVRMKGVTFRALEGSLDVGIGLSMMSPEWSVMPSSEKDDVFPRATSPVVIIGGGKARRAAILDLYPDAHMLKIDAHDSVEVMANRLNTLASLAHLVWIAPESSFTFSNEEGILEAQSKGVFQLFRLAKALLSLGYGTRELGWTVVTIQTQLVHKKDLLDPTYAGIHGLIGSLAKEHPLWKFRLLDVESHCDRSIREWFTRPVDTQGNALVCRGSEWFRQTLIPVRDVSGAQQLYRSQGVYVVIGGAGGIGEAWSRSMSERYQARIIWIGRRKKDAVIQAKLDAIAHAGPAPIYIQADATSRTSLERAYNEIKRKHSRIHGVIHSAIVLRDKSLATMKEDDFRAGVSAKIDVSIRLAQVFQKEALDFVLFFSSLISFTKAPGQSNYAAGCTFKNAFAHALVKDWSCAVKVINWGYWGSMGIVTDPVYRERMERAGIGSIEPEEGMKALTSLLEGPFDEIVLLKTLRPEAVQDLCSEEWMKACSETIPSCIGNLQEHLPEREEYAGGMLSGGGLQSGVMEDLLLEMLWGHLQSLGLFHERYSSLPDLKTKLRGLYDRWFTESLRLLKEKGYLEHDGATCADKGPSSDLEELWNRWDDAKVAWLEDPNQKAKVVLVEAALRALPDILSGRKQATDIIFPDSSTELVEGIYRGNRVADYFNETLYDAVIAYLQQRLVRDPSARIRLLEVGAGTGGTTAGLLSRLRPFQDHIQVYCYTDISKAFLMWAEEQYAPQAPYLTTRLFDVSKPLAGQRIPFDHYDLVIAANVLHATTNMRQTLRNVKAALRKNGLLVLNEISGNSLFMHLTFGLLEGWWLYEDAVLRIPGCPGLTPATWGTLLEEEGLNGVLFPAESAHGLCQQIIVAESDGVIRQQQFSTFEDPFEKGRVQTGLRSSFISRKTVRAPRDRKHTDGAHTTSRGTIAVTERMVEDHVRTIIRERVAEALKMEEGEIQDDRSFSEYGVDSIIAVELVSQINKACGIVLQTTVLFDYNNVDQLTGYIATEHQSPLRTVLWEDRASVEMEEPVSQPEEFAAGSSNGKSRYTDHGNGNGGGKRLPRPQEPACPYDTSVMKNGVTCRRLLIEGPGGVDSLRMVEAAVPELSPDEVRVAVRAFSLNFADLLCVKGLYPTMPAYPFTPGFEVSGVVAAVGNAVTSVRRGDAVMAVMARRLGAHATMVTCSEAEIFPKPARLSFEEACALPIVAITMIDAFSKAKVQPGERILIQSAAGGTGLIAVQLAQHADAEIYATAGSQKKLDYLQKQGVVHLINYQEADFELEIHRLTGGRGVDVVINTLPGDAIQKGMNCLAPGGRYIEIAMTALKSAHAVDLSVLNNNQSFYSVDIRKLEWEDPQKIRAYGAEMIRLWEGSVLFPTMCEVFPLDQIKEAYRSLENRRNIGKMVVQVSEDYQHRELSRSVGSLTLDNAVSVAASPAQEPIAIIGMSGRFAKSENLNAFWDHISRGRDLVEDVSRWDLSTYYSDSSSNGDYCHHGSFLENVDQFDPSFFKISGLDARYMDPQQRLFLEESWKALEDAGYAGESVQEKRCGIYVGCTGGDYPKLFPEHPPAQAFWGNASSIIPARIAYYLNLQGPAVAVDTACSSSLVALHLACQGLWTKETELALAGGVFIQSTPEFYLLANSAGMLSFTGRCHTFDERADGFVPGEGVGVVVLKRLQEAISDGDHIVGVIRGSGINQDGTTNGITAPSAKSQERLEREVYERFHIHPETIQMVEAHGTGTVLGDPIEYGALRRAFQCDTEKEGYCALGSVKTNIGHAATAAGVAGVLKVLLSFRHKSIPPSLHYKKGNSAIDFEKSPFYINTKLKKWTSEGNVPRRAAISSFGFSGTNAHMVLEEAPKMDRRHAKMPGYLIVLSARTVKQLRRQVERLLGVCKTEKKEDLGDMSYTLLIGRTHWNHRLACVVRSRKELIGLFEKWLEKESLLNVYVSNLQQGERREQTSLKRYGNQCVQECRTTVDAAEYLEHLSTLADLYVQGYRLNFDGLFGEGYSRTSLPTYPFARERCWVEGDMSTFNDRALAYKHTLPVETKSCNPTSMKEGSFSVNHEKRWLVLTEHWVPSPIPDRLDWYNGLKQYEGKRIYLLYDEECDRETVCSLLKQIEQAAGLSHGLCVEALHIRNIAEHAFADLPETILFMGPKRVEYPSTEPVVSDLSLVFSVSQRLMQKAWDQSITIYYLYESDLVQPRLDCEALSGFLKSAMVENPRHIWRSIGSYDDYTATARSQLLLKEWLMDQVEKKAEVPFAEVRYKRSERLAPRLLESPVPPASPSIIRSDGVYLIVGGLGPVGELLCQEFARRYQRTLILLSQGAWNEEKQAQCRKLEAAGSRVFYHAVDITDQAALQETYATIKKQVKTIHGVIHLARRVEDGLIASKSWDSFKRVMGAKVRGTLNLDTVTADEPLDFFMFFSSMAAFGIRGSSDYGYSSAFQNSFAHYRNRLHRQGERSGRTVSVCWGAWTVDRYQPEGRDQNFRDMGFDLIDMESAFPLMESAHFYEEAILGVMAVRQPERVRNLLGLKTNTQGKLEGAAEAVGGGAELPGKEAARGAQGEDASDDLTQIIRDIVVDVLKLKEANTHETFQNYGLDSIAGMQVATRLEKELQMEMKPKWLIDFPTISGLAKHLKERPDFNTSRIRSRRRRESRKANEASSSRNIKREVRLFPVAPAQKIAREPIAIIGLSGYLPGSMSVPAFWEALDVDRCMIEEIPKSRFDWDDIYDPLGQDPEKSHTKWGGFIPDIQGFDPGFFKISPAEVDSMDPRQRLLLMSVYHTLEDAGYAPESLKQSRTGVFIGAENNEYIQNLLEWGIVPKEAGGHVESMLANRISYFFDFLGPSEVVNTMCSAAAVAMHRAVCSLRSGEITHTIVGAANLLLRPEPFVTLSQRGEMSAENTVHSFGKAAKGYVRAEGVASLLLKPLSQAEADGDPIYALIKNTAVNYNGQGGMSIAAPYTPSHMNLIQTCYRQAGVEVERIGYIEAQGMGNPVADIAEWDACNRALTALAEEQKVTLSPAMCRISTLKPMTGHMHSASALGALFKIIRSFQTHKIHKILNFTERNPYVKTDGRPCRLASETDDWPKEEYPRLAGLHSYGSGGNNAHILVEEYSVTSALPTSLNEPVVIPLSAQTSAQRDVLVQQLMRHVRKHPEDDVGSIGYTLQVGRDAMKYRVAFVARDRDHWMQQAEGYLAGALPEGVFEGEVESKTSSPSHEGPHASAEAWVQGKQVPWEKHGMEQRSSRLHLPGYPFAKERYWVDDPRVDTGAALEEKAGSIVEDSPDRLEQVIDRLSEERIAFFLNKFDDANNGKKLNRKNGSHSNAVGEKSQPVKTMRSSRPQERIEDIVTKTVMSILRLNGDVVTPAKRFKAYGITSVIGTQLVHDLEDIFDTAIPPKWLFEYPTIRQLSEAIEDKMQHEKIGV